MRAPLSRWFKMSLAVAAASIATSLHAGTLVIDWGGTSYVSSYTSLKGTAETRPGSTTYGYSFSNPISPDGTPRFYGGASIVYLDGEGTPAFAAERFGLSNHSQIRLGTGDQGKRTAMYGMIFFKREDFINGGSTGPVMLDSESNIKIGINSTNAGGSGQVRRTRAAVYALLDGEWGWYVSGTYKQGGTAFTFNALGEELWLLHNPQTTPFAPPSSSIGDYTISGNTFEAIDAIGFFFEYVTPANGGEISLYVTSFQADVAAIPEPSTVAFLVGGSLLFAVVRHRVLVR